MLFNHDFFYKTPNKVLKFISIDKRLTRTLRLPSAIDAEHVEARIADGVLTLTLPKGSNTGRALRLKGKGFSKKGGGRGDQLVTLEIDLPEDVSELSARLDGWKDTRDIRSRLGV